jgi:hypothetical protein
VKRLIAVACAVLSVAGPARAESATAEDFTLAIAVAGTTDQHTVRFPGTGGTVDLAVLLTTQVDGVEGWSYGVEVKPGPDVTATITRLDPGAGMATVWNGSPPAFQALTWFPGEKGQGERCEPSCREIAADSFTQVVSVCGPSCNTQTSLPATDNLVCASFTVVAAAPGGAGRVHEVRIEFSDDVGAPPVLTQVLHDAFGIPPAVKTPVLITLSDPMVFRRGDMNCDGSINIADAIYLLQYQFVGGSPIYCCADAADANDDEAVNIADAIYTLQRLFSGGPPIPPPHPECGEDLTPHPDGGPDLPACHYCAEACGTAPSSCPPPS